MLVVSSGRGVVFALVRRFRSGGGEGHFVVPSKDSLQGFGEGEVEGNGDGEGEVERLSAGSLSSRGVEEFLSYFFYDGGDPLRKPLK
jgi:hypothetical protein